MIMFVHGRPTFFKQTWTSCATSPTQSNVGASAVFIESILCNAICSVNFTHLYNL